MNFRDSMKIMALELHRNYWEAYKNRFLTSSTKSRNLLLTEAYLSFYSGQKRPMALSYCSSKQAADPFILVMGIFKVDVYLQRTLKMY